MSPRLRRVDYPQLRRRGRLALALRLRLRRRPATATARFHVLALVQERFYAGQSVHTQRLGKEFNGGIILLLVHVPACLFTISQSVAFRSSHL